MNRSLITLAVLALMAEPVGASTIPRVDFKAFQTDIAVGVPDANVDFAVMDRLSLGVSVIPLPLTDPLSPLASAVRGTYRFAEWPSGISLGVTASLLALSNKNLNRAPGVEPSIGFLVQPALNVAVPFQLGPVSTTFRGTIGPLVNPVAPQFSTWVPWPNLELAFKLAPAHELTLGGNSLIGWRGSF